MKLVLRLVSAVVGVIAGTIILSQGLALLEMRSNNESLGVGSARSEFISSTLQAAALLLVSAWVLTREGRLVPPDEHTDTVR